MHNRYLRDTLSRRGLLKNVGLMALLAPVLRQSEAWAAPLAPRRIIFVYSPNGPTRAVGPAMGTETNFTLHDWWSPLTRHKADGLFLSHMAQTGAGTVSGDGLGLGAQMFSGFGAGVGADIYAQKGETIDQIIGKRLETQGQAGVARSVVWGSSRSSNTRGVGDVFSSGAARSIAPEVNPAQAWAQLFAQFMPNGNPADAARAAALLARNKSVLDFVSKDCAALKSALGVEGTRLLDDHCTTVRSIESNLVKVLPTNACTKPTQPTAEDGTNPERYAPQCESFFNVATAALSCELTRVVAFQLGAPHARNQIASGFGVPSAPRNDSVGDQGPDHHGWTHQGSSPNTLKALQTFTNYYASQVALLVDKLKAAKDASGASLFDSTVVIWASEHGGHPSMEDPHSPAACPLIILGNGQGTFKTGRYLKGRAPDLGAGAGYAEAGKDTAKVMVAMLHYMGLTDLMSIGATGVTGPLTSLLA
jgi:Protein of unknown function (DUF1552)